MKKLLLALGTITAISFLGTPVLASNTPNIKLQIFPLECSLDSVALGNVNSLQLTPENCLPGTPEPPTTVTPPTSNDNGSVFIPGRGSTVFLNDPVLTIPSTNFPISNIRGPLIVDPREVAEEKSANQAQTSSIVVSAVILVSAGFLAAAHAIYTGVIAPLAAQGNLPKIRFPWSKK